jgi:hypothetical protein
MMEENVTRLEQVYADTGPEEIKKLVQQATKSIK